MQDYDPNNTRGAMDPPANWLYLPSRVAIALAINIAGGAIYALAAWQMPTLGWLWPIGVCTVLLTVALVVRDALLWEGV